MEHGRQSKYLIISLMGWYCSVEYIKGTKANERWNSDSKIFKYPTLTKIHILCSQTFADIWIELYSSDVNNGPFQQAIEIEPYQLPKQKSAKM